MAQVNYTNKEKILVSAFKEVITSVNITLTKEEAETIAMIANAIGGCPTKTRRLHVNNIREALASVGIVVEPAARPEENGYTGAIYFDC